MNLYGISQKGLEFTPLEFETSESAIKNAGNGD